MADGLPLGGGEIAEGRQIAAVLGAHGLQLLQSLVDFRTLHKKNPFSSSGKAPIYFIVLIDLLSLMAL